MREITYASDQLALARSMAETDEQRERLEECERRLRGAGRSGQAAAQAQRQTSGSRTANRLDEQLDGPDAAPAARLEPGRPPLRGESTPRARASTPSR